MQSYTYIYIHVLPILTCDDLFPKPLQHLYSTSPDLSSTTPVMMMMMIMIYDYDDDDVILYEMMMKTFVKLMIDNDR